MRSPRSIGASDPERSTGRDRKDAVLRRRSSVKKAAIRAASAFSHAKCRIERPHPSMVKITYIDSYGESRTVEAEEGTTVMENAIRNSIPEIVAECGGGCACATCHVYVDEAWYALTGQPSTKEEDMLDFAYKVQQNSRLSCQIKVTPELDGLVVTTPDRQG
jgi:ferredoxin, 2Fe-2S